jgi:hypothetical protein
MALRGHHKVMRNRLMAKIARTDAAWQPVLGERFQLGIPQTGKHPWLGAGPNGEP